MGSWYSVPLVIVGLVSMLGSAMVLAFSGLPYAPLTQVFDQVNPYGDPQDGDPQVYVSGRITLQGGDAQDLTGSTVVITGPIEVDPVTIYTYTTFDGTFALPLDPGVYHLEAALTGWASRTLEFEIAEEDVNLGVISLLLDTVGDCPGSLPGEGGSLSILSVSASPSPTNSLIQNFDVQLSEPGVVWVEYFPRANTEEVLSFGPTPNVDTTQQFPVMRLTADTEYCYQVYARSRSDSGPVSDSFPGEFATGPLPAGLADSSFNKIIGTQTYDLTLLDFADDDFSGIVALDEDADVVWYYEHDSAVHAIAQKEDLNLVFSQGNHQSLVEIKPDGTEVSRITDVLDDGTPCMPDGRWHHESLVRPDGRILFLGSEIRDVNIDGDIRPQTGDIIMEWDQNLGTVTPLVRLFDLLDPVIDRTDAPNGTFWQGCDGEATTEDWTHSNAIWVTDNGTHVMSVRHLNQILAISPDLQSVLWQLGGPGSDFSFPDPNDRFYHQHSVKLLPNGNVLLFDNGNVRPEEEGGQYSRALELELDFDNLVARKVWEYRYTPDRYATCCSSVQRLENGNTVLVFGSDSTREVCCRVFTLAEADAEGETVSAIEITSPGKRIQYRAYALDSMNGEFLKK
jgi:hypothetical protein